MGCSGVSRSSGKSPQFQHLPPGTGVTLPEVCPQKKKRLDCLMMVMPGTSTVYWEGGGEERG